MAYKTEELEATALKAIKDYNLMFIEDVVVYLPCSKSTFYDHKLDESNAIKALMEKNRIKTKANMRKKWYDSDNPTLQIGLMKLIGDDVERKKLSQGFIDITTKDEKLGINVFTQMSDGDMARLASEFASLVGNGETPDDDTDETTTD